MEKPLEITSSLRVRVLFERFDAAGNGKPHVDKNLGEQIGADMRAKQGALSEAAKHANPARSPTRATA